MTTRLGAPYQVGDWLTVTKSDGTTIRSQVRLDEDNDLYLPNVGALENTTFPHPDDEELGTIFEPGERPWQGWSVIRWERGDAHMFASDYATLEDAQDAIASVWSDARDVLDAKTAREFAEALIKLGNSSFDIATYHNDFDDDRGEIVGVYEDL